MRKDFSQEFDQNSETQIELIIQDSVSKQYLLFTSAVAHEEDFYHILSLKSYISKSLSLKLTHYLFENHLVLNSYRELVKQTSVSFSFADDTPGTESSSACLYVNADVTDMSSLNSDTAIASFVSLPELLQKLSDGPYIGQVTELGIAKLLAENSILS